MQAWQGHCLKIPNAITIVLHLIKKYKCEVDDKGYTVIKVYQE